MKITRRSKLLCKCLFLFFLCCWSALLRTRVDLCFWPVPSRPMLHTCVRNEERCPFFLSVAVSFSLCCCVIRSQIEKCVVKFLWCPQHRSKSCFFVDQSEKSDALFASFKVPPFFQVQNAFLGCNIPAKLVLILGHKNFFRDTKAFGSPKSQNITQISRKQG